MQNFALKAKSAIKKVAALGAGAVMLGATVGAAAALDLGEYPSPFIVSGKYDSSNVLVVGASADASDTLGAVDISNGLQFESKTCSGSGGSVTVSGGVTEEIPLGSAVADANSYTFDTELEDDDINTFLDTTITFQSADYDVHEVLAFADGNSTIETSLTSADDDYETDVAMEVMGDAIKYFYLFDQTIQPNKSTAALPLEIKFLGKTLKITNVDSSSNKFTAYVGTEYFMGVADSVEVSGKKVTLANVGSGGAIVVDVDGVSETIPAAGTETVNGIEITNDETFYEDNKDQRSATLVIGKESQETYQDGDPYVGEDEDDPNWVWDIDNLNDNAASSLLAGAADVPTSTASTSYGPKLGIENDFVWNDDSDNPIGVGECLDLPNNYVAICLDSLTVKDDDYLTLTFEFDTSADLSKSCGGCTALTAAKAIYIHTNKDETLVVDDSGLDNSGNITSDKKTDKIWLTDLYAVTGASDTDKLSVYYEDTDNKVQYAGYVNSDDSAAVEFGYIESDNTKGSDATLYVTAGTNGVTPEVRFYDATYLSSYENISMNFSATADVIKALGDTLSSEEAGEVVWSSGGKALLTNVGTKDEDQRTQYGTILRDQKSHGASDEVVMEIPGDEVFANVVIKGTAATTSTSSSNCAITKVDVKSMLDTEVTNPANYNLIVVGGPAINAIAEQFIGSADDFRATYSAGEAVIKLVANGDKVAMVVAGYNAMDTRRAAKVLSNYKDYALAGTSVTVKGTTLTDMTVVKG
ncbi:MAG: S-layer protein [Candidatus Nanoarchaeia archaeon]|nr:S-layer protein [Candidatus Nanoarchaeia archaeon]